MTMKHQPNPPIKLEGVGVFCGCHECQERRERFTASKPAMLAELPDEGEDTDDAPNSGHCYEHMWQDGNGGEG